MSSIKEQILTLVKQRHHSHKVALEQEKDPRSKHAIDLIARIREDSQLIDLIDSLPEEKPSDDLEEAAEISFDEAYALTEDYRDFLAKGLTENKPRPIGPHWFCEYAKKRFIAGAEWQKRHFTVEDIKTILDIAFWNNDPEKILDEYNRIKYGDQ